MTSAANFTGAYGRDQGERASRTSREPNDSVFVAQLRGARGGERA